MSIPFSEIIGLIFLVSQEITSYIKPEPILIAMFDPSLVAIILLTVGTGIAVNFLTDILKDLITEREGKKKTHVTEIKKPDGKTLLIVDINEDMSPEDADRIAKRITDTAEGLNNP
jgi:hypothetical protein